ncbi:hypothetical protein GCM10020295_51070 [Streptomyces cinereospinus]
MPGREHPGAAGAPERTSSTAPRRPSWARPDDPSAGPGHPASFLGPRTVLVVDGDPGGAALREAVARLALDGPRAGIHVVCLAETAPASPASPVTETYEAACAAAPVFRECGAVALLSGDVATALHLLRVARAGTAAGPAAAAPVGHGTVGTVDAVSPAWAERFARALAPLRTDAAATGTRHARLSAPCRRPRGSSTSSGSPGPRPPRSWPAGPTPPTTPTRSAAGRTPSSGPARAARSPWTWSPRDRIC